MSSVKQLDYVEKYMSSKSNLKTLSDLYMAVLWPAGVGKSESYVLWSKNSVQYRQNAPLDKNKDGKITKQEAASCVVDRRKLFKKLDKRE